MSTVDRDEPTGREWAAALSRMPPQDVEYDYSLDVTCDHAGRMMDPAPVRVIARLLHKAPLKAIGRFEWAEAVLPDAEPGDPDVLQTYYGVAAEMGRFGQRKADGSHYAPGDLVPGMAGERWRFWCKDCDDTLPLLHSKLEPVLERLRAAGVEMIGLRALARYTV